jgi:hypothetical protein
MNAAVSIRKPKIEKKNEGKSHFLGHYKKELHGTGS